VTNGVLDANHNDVDFDAQTGESVAVFSAFLVIFRKELLAVGITNDEVYRSEDQKRDGH
jgi:hypothetical protein